MSFIISTMYKLEKFLPKYWYISEKVCTFASSKVIIHSINKLNSLNYGICNW